MRPDAFSQHKRFAQVGDTRVAYLDHGDGPPLLLLHGCPFSCFVWRKTIPLLSAHYRCIAPDLLGLGDTQTPPEADWSLPAQAAAVLGLLDALRIDAAHLVGHDHGAAIAQLLAAHHPHRIRRLVITNAEAYDNWPSHEELPFLRLSQLPLVGTLALWAWSKRPVLRLALRTGRAVHNPAVLTPELLDGYIRANLADRHRRAETRRFLAGQLDPTNQRHTLAALAGLRRFDHPTLLIWGRDDPHFGPQWAQRLYADIPGAHQLELLPAAGHLLMEEQPERLAALIADFLAEPRGTPTHRPSAHHPAVDQKPSPSSLSAGQTAMQPPARNPATSANAARPTGARAGMKAPGGTTQ
jgi:pimeloyl-ACP methyl ester carboxylesterase